MSFECTEVVREDTNQGRGFLKATTYPTVANPTGENHLDLLLGVPYAYDTFCTGKEIRLSDFNTLLNVDDWIKKVDLLLTKS